MRSKPRLFLRGRTSRSISKMSCHSCSVGAVTPFAPPLGAVALFQKRHGNAELAMQFEVFANKPVGFSVVFHVLYFFCCILNFSLGLRRHLGVFQLREDRATLVSGYSGIAINALSYYVCFDKGRALLLLLSKRCLFSCHNSVTREEIKLRRSDFLFTRHRVECYRATRLIFR